ncbi:MAG: pyridoxamine 5'-phosphate oxidase family protein [Paracoccaceae bacterium]|jgi:PPOX class probable FMN-dependent enzyme|nr:pyridoxamine 5'-phosphate oxidase family protein [Paracoccaceae bacterium]MDG1369827.1 pyridoxamine 5'-phosphate oxidase family protein [Paracoccaceae bacterium]
METIDSIEALEAHYGETHPAAILKVANRMAPAYRKWIEASRFCVMSTVGPEGVDGTPRGDDGPVVRELDDKTLAMPDWRGNNRIDSLRNIVRDGRIALMFMVPGDNIVIRVNGKAKLTADEDLRKTWEQKGKHPATVILIHIEEVYAQCPKALIRSRLWSSGDESDGLPSLGDMLTEMSKGDFDGAAFDKNSPERIKETIW